MRAALLRGSHFEIEKVPDPIASVGQLLVAPLATEICGSDLHLREQMTEVYAATPEDGRAALPAIVPGHEFSATIVEAGSGVEVPDNLAALTEPLAPGLIDQIIINAPPHSHIIVVGVCAHEDKFTPINCIQKELTIEFSFAYTMEEFRQALHNAAAQPMLVARLITKEARLENTESAFDALAKDPEEIKVLIIPQ